MNKKSAIPSNEAFWINDPPEQRQAVANAYAAVPLLSLGLPVRPYNVVRRNKRYPDVGALMMAGSDIWDLRGMGLESMRRIHASLAPLFANKDGISVRGSDSATAHAIPKQWLELVHRLQSREDLAGLSLDRLGLNQTSWPWLPQPIPPTLGQLGVESARRWWIASENRAAHREQLVTWAQSLAQIPTPVDEDELVRHWLRCGIQVVPIGSIGPDQSLEPLLVGLLQEHLVTHRNELDWEILRHRSGLGDATEMTLQDLGQALGLTRERIRQRETKVYRSVQTWWSNCDHFYRPKFLHPALQDAVAGLRELIRQVRAAPLDEARWPGRVSNSCGTPARPCLHWSGYWRRSKDSRASTSNPTNWVSCGSPRAGKASRDRWLAYTPCTSRSPVLPPPSAP
ncbi:MAG: hypothetical protein IPL60_02885 [Ardenticatenia bacterium]|nr:hypothetical protein [Ardenticatenia bacterium]